MNNCKNTSYAPAGWSQQRRRKHCELAVLRFPAGRTQQIGQIASGNSYAQFRIEEMDVKICCRAGRAKYFQVTLRATNYRPAILEGRLPNFSFDWLAPD